MYAKKTQDVDTTAPCQTITHMMIDDCLNELESNGAERCVHHAICCIRTDYAIDESKSWPMLSPYRIDSISKVNPSNH